MNEETRIYWKALKHFCRSLRHIDIYRFGSMNMYRALWAWRMGWRTAKESDGQALVGDKPKDHVGHYDDSSL